ncbi:terpene synthase 10-like [Impatiens glandulifera]|uniref:terpene synthase 10-like n=1 Tax=Impatiens glandulifera TaxID=253017 RepID=UPI001FB078E8|nr:terpene synthase 10-like [Impatiens glandulifera]
MALPNNLMKSGSPKTYGNMDITTINGRLLKKTVVYCKTTSTIHKSADHGIIRRSANYGPPLWSHDFIQSISSIYKGEIYEDKAAKLKEEVMMLLEKNETPLEKLELIDNVQRLGISYHFDTKLDNILNLLYNHTDWLTESNLHETSLKFRLFRQRGYDVPQEVFDKFKDKNGDFSEALHGDTKGLLSLYEATFHGFEGESTLDEARRFALKYLNTNVMNTNDLYLEMLVRHALELPLHWTMQRFEARWFIDAYGMQAHANDTLLDFAKLDFNMVQAIHQEELKHVSRWWQDLKWNEHLPFVRDRTVESYSWVMGQCHEPHIEYSEYRILASRFIHLTTTFDDIYDIYGTLDELELFTNAIERWDVNLVEQLPDYMKICFLGNFNSINELGYRTLQEGVHAIPYLKKVWTDICKSFLKEARWFHNGNVPTTFKEFLDNGWISIGIPLVSAHTYFLIANPQTSPITKIGLDAIENYHDIIKWPSVIGRLSNDLATSKNEIMRGDAIKSVQSYMQETNSSTNDANEHVKDLIEKAWKKINTARASSNCPFSKRFMDITINHARVAQYVYQYGDGFGHDIFGKNKNRTSLLLFEPIPLSLN